MLLLPKAADKPLSDTVKSLDGAAVTNLLSNRISADVQVSMPKLDQESTLTLNDALVACGMTDAFGDQADFSAITGSKNDLYISSVLQKTYIEVSEKGTKAAAATEIGIETMAMPVEADPVVADRPYVYMIVDLEHSVPGRPGSRTDGPGSRTGSAGRGRGYRYHHGGGRGAERAAGRRRHAGQAGSGKAGVCGAAAS